MRGLKSTTLTAKTFLTGVAPYMRCVDWNLIQPWKEVRKMRRTLHEVRGLKCPYQLRHFQSLCVAPYMRCVDWNQCELMNCTEWYQSHLTWGAWIEINWWLNGILIRSVSHLTWGAWIEIPYVSLVSRKWITSHLTWGAWIEISDFLRSAKRFSSHLTWGAWIEIK